MANRSGRFVALDSLAPAVAGRSGTILPYHPQQESCASDAAAEAWQAGYRAGMAASEHEQAAKAGAEARAAAGLQLAFGRLDTVAQAELAAYLARTVARLCRETLGEAAFDSDALQRRCALAAAALDTAPDVLTLHLSAPDIALLPSGFLQRWNVKPDPDLPRGALRLEGPDGGIADGPEQWSERVRAALAAC